MLSIMSQNQHTSAKEQKIKHTHAYESKPSILMLVSQKGNYPTTSICRCRSSPGSSADDDPLLKPLSSMS